MGLKELAERAAIKGITAIIGGAAKLSQKEVDIYKKAEEAAMERGGVINQNKYWATLHTQHADTGTKTRNRDGRRVEADGQGGYTEHSNAIQVPDDLQIEAREALWEHGGCKSNITTVSGNTYKISETREGTQITLVSRK